jgi:hypothetical protein
MKRKSKLLHEQSSGDARERVVVYTSSISTIDAVVALSRNGQEHLLFHIVVACKQSLAGV